MMSFQRQKRMSKAAYTETTPKPGRQMDLLIDTYSSVLSALNFFLLHPDEAFPCATQAVSLVRQW
jgi:hypothetical protein